MKHKTFSDLMLSKKVDKEMKWLIAELERKSEDQHSPEAVFGDRPVSYKSRNNRTEEDILFEQTL